MLDSVEPIEPDESYDPEILNQVATFILQRLKSRTLRFSLLAASTQSSYPNPETTGVLENDSPETFLRLTEIAIAEIRALMKRFPVETRGRGKQMTKELAHGVIQSLPIEFRHIALVGAMAGWYNPNLMRHVYGVTSEMIKSHEDEADDLTFAQFPSYRGLYSTPTLL